MNQHHQMILKNKYSSGAEEWHCPACGRRFLVKWPPTYEMIILESGDQNARHSGSTGDLAIGTLQVAQADETQLTEELRLRPWMKWLEEVNFENWWGKSD